jgi:two-component system sensor histidine kinase VicK
MNSTLERQLKRIYGKLENVPPDCDKLIEVVQQQYLDFQDDYNLMERSLEISSLELTELNQQLQKEAEIIEKEVQDRTQELNIERIKLEIVTENMRTGAILTDCNQQVLFINRPARNFINFHEDGFEGVIEKLCETFLNYPIREYIEQCTHDVSLELDNVEAGDLIFHILFQRISRQENNSFGSLIWINNVTDEKQLERAKSELLAVASHQLRTPLTVTKGNTEVLLDESYGPLTIDQRDILRQTQESNQNMINLVNQMLDITKIEQGKFTFRLSETPITDVLDQVITDLYSKTEQQPSNLQYTPSTDTSPIIYAERTRLYQVFQNLIDNAIKYSQTKNPDPVVRISTSRTAETISISVQDEGIGIPKKDRDKIFSRFYRASNAESSFIDGTGLGLHVVKSIVQSFKGKIEFTSEEGIGTTFTVTFPIAANTNSQTV